MSNYTDLAVSQRDLLEKWKQSDFAAGNLRFIYDGCPDSVKYAQCPIKIMFLLRECYFDERDRCDPKGKHKPWVKYFQEEDANWTYDLANNLHQEAPWHMWCKVNNLLDILYRSFWPEYPGGKALDYAGYVNLRKGNAGDADAPNNNRVYSDPIIIDKSAEKNSSLLIKQINLLTPDIVICGGTYDTANKYKLLGRQENSISTFLNTRGLRSINRHLMEQNGTEKSILVVDMWHPSASISPTSIGEALVYHLQFPDYSISLQKR